MYKLPHDTHLTLSTIVSPTIFKDDLQLSQELLTAAITVVGQLPLDSGEVHRLLDYFVVVRDVQLPGVDGFVEDPGVVGLPQRLYELLAGRFPWLGVWQLFECVPVVLLPVVLYVLVGTKELFHLLFR